MGDQFRSKVVLSASKSSQKGSFQVKQRREHRFSSENSNELEKIKAFDDKGAVPHKFAHVKAFEDSGPSRTPERVMRRNPSQKLKQFDDFKRRRFRIRRDAAAAEKMKTCRIAKASCGISYGRTFFYAEVSLYVRFISRGRRMWPQAS